MKSLLSFVAVCCLTAFVGCASTQSADVSPGAVAECSTDCASACCDADKAAQCPYSGEQADEVSPGAVGESSECSSKASECSSKASECSDAKVCPVTGNAIESDASLGAVSETSDCSASKSGCSSSKTGCGSQTDG